MPSICCRRADHLARLFPSVQHHQRPSQGRQGNGGPFRRAGRTGHVGQDRQAIQAVIGPLAAGWICRWVLDARCRMCSRGCVRSRDRLWPGYAAHRHVSDACRNRRQMQVQPVPSLAESGYQPGVAGGLPVGCTPRASPLTILENYVQDERLADPQCGVRPYGLARSLALLGVRVYDSKARLHVDRLAAPDINTL